MRIREVRGKEGKERGKALRGNIGMGERGKILQGKETEGKEWKREAIM